MNEPNKARQLLASLSRRDSRKRRVGEAIIVLAALATIGMFIQGLMDGSASDAGSDSGQQDTPQSSEREDPDSSEPDPTGTASPDPSKDPNEQATPPSGEYVELYTAELTVEVSQFNSAYLELDDQPKVVRERDTAPLAAYWTERANRGTMTLSLVDDPPAALSNERELGPRDCESLIRRKLLGRTHVELYEGLVMCLETENRAGMPLIAALEVTNLESYETTLSVTVWQRADSN